MIGLPLTQGLYETALRIPARSADALRIVSGYASPAFLNRLLDDLKTDGLEGRRIELVVGMSGVDGVNSAHHAGFQRVLREHAGQVEVRYVPRGRSNHSKLYVWTARNAPVTAFAGSSNFTLNGFMMNSRRPHHQEMLFGVDHVAAMRCFEEGAQFTIPADDPLVDDNVDILPAVQRPPGAGAQQASAAPSHVAPPQDAAATILPLVIVAPGRRQGEIHGKWGLNWGQRPGRNPNQAAIPYPNSAKAQNASGFFPIGPAGRRERFTVLTDDGFSIEMIVAEENDKALHSHPTNDVIGVYFRRRLGVALGARVEVQDLVRNGSRFVRFTKIDDETFYMEYNPSVESEGCQLYHLQGLPTGGASEH